MLVAIAVATNCRAQEVKELAQTSASSFHSIPMSKYTYLVRRSASKVLGSTSWKQFMFRSAQRHGPSTGTAASSLPSNSHAQTPFTHDSYKDR
ncbi:HET-domain-containing protein [Moniliophthora roreri]|nr:HET-domain-containing protein [Moniliophthora roreri]